MQVKKILAIFNCSNRADRERKASLIKKWQKKLETFKSEKRKVVSSSFQERFN